MKIVDVVSVPFVELADVGNLRIGQAATAVVGSAKFREAVVVFLLALGVGDAGAVTDEEAAVLGEIRVKSDAAEAFGAPIENPVRSEDAIMYIEKYFGAWIGQI